MPLTLTSSSSESDLEELQSKSDSTSLASSDSSDSSESDDLENWMILGRGNQDGDQSISLNLEGGTDSNAGGMFLCNMTFIFVHMCDRKNKSYKQFSMVHLIQNP